MVFNNLDEANSWKEAMMIQLQVPPGSLINVPCIVKNPSRCRFILSINKETNARLKHLITEFWKVMAKARKKRIRSSEKIDQMLKYLKIGMFYSSTYRVLGPDGSIIVDAVKCLE